MLVVHQAKHHWWCLLTRAVSVLSRFDFDHSHEISQHELVLLLLCTTRGLCKVIGLDRPITADLEALATSAFVSIDRDASGAISLSEFTAWALHEPSLRLYLERFAATRLIYESQRAYDALLQRLCNAFVTCAVPLLVGLSSPNNDQQLACSAETCRDVLTRQCPSTTALEADYLVQAMAETMARRVSAEWLLPPLQMVTLEVFCIVAAPYAAFVIADEDAQHVLSRAELLVLLWLLRGKEPSPATVESYLHSLDHDKSDTLSALEWVTYAVENDARTGRLAFAIQVQLLFTNADQNGGAVLSLQELTVGLKAMVLQAFVAEEAVRVASEQKPQSQSQPSGSLQKQLLEHAEAVDGLIAGLANELLLALDKNQLFHIEWFEFRPQLDYLETRMRETIAYIRDFVLK